MQMTPALRCAAAMTAATALFAVLGPTVGAQDFGAERRGLSASVGLGASSAGVACVPKCKLERYSGASFLLRGAAHVTPQLAIVFEANGF